MAIKFDFKDNYLIGVISDTHGHVPPGLQRAFEKVDLIIHAGDIGDEKVLDKLSKIAAVVAVRGNMDFGKWTRQLPETEIVEIGQIVLYVLHIEHRLDVDPNKAGFKAIISGHTHRPDVYEESGVTFLNPGSASYPKFGNPASAALIQIQGDSLGVKLIRLKD
ncbi:MAG: metallophosphoesterase family protein [Desulfobacterales bacterium]|nr:metallophosphoesterase family protein [Desulfobacterales bacterium]MCK5202611.1 metallophosphoesterase family protein [Desulfobacterales bacterium]